MMPPGAFIPEVKPGDALPNSGDAINGSNDSQPPMLNWSLFNDAEKYVVMWAILTMGLVALSFNKKSGNLAVGLAFGVFFAVGVTIMRHRKMI